MGPSSVGIRVNSRLATTTRCNSTKIGKPCSEPQLPIDEMMKNLVLGVVGWSGSGKTTLLEQLLPQLTAQGWRVNVIKHSHHDLMFEPAHKDSARLRAAGAAEVMVASPHRFAIFHELRDTAEPPLAEQLARLAPADLTLVEGFKNEPIPKLEIYRQAMGKPAGYRDDPWIVAVAADVPAPADAPPALAWLDLNQPEAVLAWLMGYLKAER